MMKNSTIITMTPDGIVGLSKHNIAKGMGTWTRNVCITKMIKHKVNLKVQEHERQKISQFTTAIGNQNDYINNNVLFVNNNFKDIIRNDLKEVVEVDSEQMQSYLSQYHNPRNLASSSNFRDPIRKSSGLSDNSQIVNHKLSTSLVKQNLRSNSSNSLKSEDKLASVLSCYSENLRLQFIQEQSNEEEFFKKSNAEL